MDVCYLFNGHLAGADVCMHEHAEKIHIYVCMHVCFPHGTLSRFTHVLYACMHVFLTRHLAGVDTCMHEHISGRMEKMHIHICMYACLSFSRH